MQTAKEVSENLETKYKNLWTNPNQDKPKKLEALSDSKVEQTESP
jgi:hypothetical protein